MLQQTGSHYDRVAKTLHWLIALAILFMLVLGWVMDDLEGPQKFKAFQLHKSIGITILLLSLLRLVWRLTHHFPPLPEGTKNWEKKVVCLTHYGFYLLIIGMPLTGWAIVSASTLNIPTLLYGLIPWPPLPVLPTLDNKRAVGHIFGEIHGVLAYVMAGFIVLHAGAAWKHHLINRDDVLLRMAPRFMGRLLSSLRGDR